MSDSFEINTGVRQGDALHHPEPPSKTEFITNLKSASEEMILEIAKIKCVKKYKYLGKWIETNLVEKTRMQSYWENIKSQWLNKHGLK